MFEPFDPIKSLEKHLGEFDFNSRVPFYNDSSDYTTNAPSYYDDLSRKNKLIKHLALRIWDYDKELAKRFEAWDKNLEDFPDDIKKLLEKWIDDGTFADIINNEIFNNLNSEIELIKNISGANPMEYGAKGDGITDDTLAFVETNKHHNTIVLPQGKKFVLNNFIPLKDTTIIAVGAEILRTSNIKYPCTESASSIIITNDNINIIGGHFYDVNDLEREVFTGSILVERGSLNIYGSKITDTWGAIFGHEYQFNGRSAEYLKVENCLFENNFHNNYLADINNFLFISNISRNSNRDGLKTFRNVKNTIVTNNHIYNNGDGNPNQSQDAIDLYISGKKAIISNNYLYGNDFLGIDIKKLNSTILEPTQGEEYIISNNFIFNNKYEGIKIKCDQEESLKNVIINGNHIYENGQFGILTDNVDHFNYINNIIYDNGHVGIRIEKTNMGGHISNNILYDNALTSSSKYNIMTLENSLNVKLKDNKIKSLTDNVIHGIAFLGTGECKENDVDVNGLNYSGNVNKNVKGKILNGTVSIDDYSFPFIFNEEGLINNIKLVFASTGSFKITINKRNLETGLNEANIYVKDIEVTENFKAIELDISDLGQSVKTMNNNNIIYVLINALDGTFFYPVSTSISYIC